MFSLHCQENVAWNKSQVNLGFLPHVPQNSSRLHTAPKPCSYFQVFVTAAPHFQRPKSILINFVYDSHQPELREDDSWLTLIPQELSNLPYSQQHVRCKKNYLVAVTFLGKVGPVVLTLLFHHCGEISFLCTFICLWGSVCLSLLSE